MDPVYISHILLNVNYDFRVKASLKRLALPRGIRQPRVFVLELTAARMCE